MNIFIIMLFKFQGGYESQKLLNVYNNTDIIQVLLIRKILPRIFLF